MNSDHWPAPHGLGFTTEQQAGEAGPQRVQTTPLEQSYVQLLVERGELQHLRPFLETSFYRGDSFELGLKRLLDGIEHEYRGK